MADNYLITGYCGKNHVTAENDRGIHAGIFGSGRYVLPVGKQFKAENIGNNTIRIYDGKLVDNGAAAGIPAGDYIDLTIPNASQGMNRNDLIVFQYSQDASTLIESGTFVVVRGTETSGAASDPTLRQEDLLSDRATFDQMALWRVPVSTGTISTPVQLFEVSKSLYEAGRGKTVVVDAISTDGSAYTATVEDLEELYNGLAITIIPNIASTTTAPTLNVNGLGAKPIRLSLSLNNSMLVQPKNNDYYAAGRPIQLMFDAKYLSSGAWRVSNKQRPSAEDLYGTSPVTSGGTGVDSVTAGSFLVGKGEEPMQEMTPTQVREHIGAGTLGFVPLWENASVGGQFEEQEIEIPSLSDYSVIAIGTVNGIYFISTDSDYQQGLTTANIHVTETYSNYVLCSRVVEVYQDSNFVGVEISDCYICPQGSTSKAEVNNAHLIPYGIYGVCKKEGTA